MQRLSTLGQLLRIAHVTQPRSFVRSRESARAISYSLHVSPAFQRPNLRLRTPVRHWWGKSDKDESKSKADETESSHSDPSLSMDEQTPSAKDGSTKPKADSSSPSSSTTQTTTSTTSSASSTPSSAASQTPTAAAPPSPALAEAEKKIASLTEKLKKTEEQLTAITEKLKERERQAAQLQDRYLRVSSEIENVRRVAREDVAKAQKFGTQSFAKNLLTVVDEMALSLKNFPADESERNADQRLKSVYDGLVLISKSLNKVLEQNGIVKINSMNEKFNPNLHDAIFQIEAPDQEPDTVAQVLKEGFMINDRVLRPATVGVTKGGKPRAAATPASNASPADANATANPNANAGNSGAASATDATAKVKATA